MDMINEIGRWLQEKEVLPTALERLGMEDKLAEIVLISLGITFFFKQKTAYDI